MSRSASETTREEVPARYGSTTMTVVCLVARRPAASNGRGVFVYATATSMPSVAASTASSIGPTASSKAAFGLLLARISSSRPVAGRDVMFCCADSLM